MRCGAKPETFTDIVREVGAANAARLFFLSNTDEERTQSCRLRGMEYRHETGARGDHPAVGKADPLALVFIEQLLADGPVLGLVFAAVGVNLPGNLGRKLVDCHFIRHNPAGLIEGMDDR